MSTKLMGLGGRRPTRLLGALAVGVALVATGCSSSTSDRTTATATSAPLVADTVAHDTVAADTVAAGTTTTAAPETTVAATTTEAPTTTAAPAHAPLILRGQGVGSFDLGMPYAEVLAGITAQLTFVSDDSYEFPVVDDYGGHRSADGSLGFSAPFGRVVCWSDGSSGKFCAAFGGAHAGALTFTGWRYSGNVLTTISGVTGGSRWSDFPTMITPGQSGCFQNSAGSIDGVLVSVVSAGAPFGSYDAAGSFVPGDPNPADVSVTELDAGNYPYDTNADC